MFFTKTEHLRDDTEKNFANCNNNFSQKLSVTQMVTFQVKLDTEREKRA